MALSERMFGVASLITLLVASLLFLVGFGTEYWVDIGYNTHSGVWRTCFLGVCGDFGSSAPDWLKSVQAFETLALLGAGAGAVFLLLSICLSQGAFHKIMAVLAVVGICGAAGCCILGIIIYGAEVESNFGYSFYLTLVGGIGMGVAGILAFIDMCK